MAIGRIPEPGTGIPESIVDAKGDIVTATAADTPARLAVGTNEHRLVAASGEATGLKYVADTTNYAIAAKGDLLVGSAADTLSALSVGTNGHTLVADSSESLGVKWAAPAGGGMTLLDTLTLSGTSVTSTTFSSSYAQLVIFIKQAHSGTNQQLNMRLNADTGANYSWTFVNDGTMAATSTGTTFLRVGNIGTSGSVLNAAYQRIELMRPEDSDVVFVTTAAQYIESGSVQNFDCTGVYDSSAAITSVTFYIGSSTFGGGTVYIYGVK